MSRNDSLAHCTEMGLRSHNPVRSTWLYGDFLSGGWELAAEWGVFCLPLWSSLCPDLLQGSVTRTGSLALVYLPLLSPWLMGSSSRGLERGWRWDRAFLPLAPTLLICSGHPDFSTRGWCSLGSSLLRASYSGLGTTPCASCPEADRGSPQWLASLKVLHYLFP